MQLPNELILIIFEKIKTFDYRESNCTLSACAQTCKSWNQMVEKYLWSDLAIDSDGFLLHCLAENKKKLNHVKQLKIYKRVDTKLTSRLLMQCPSLESLYLNFYSNLEDLEYLKTVGPFICKRLKHLVFQRSYFSYHPSELLACFAGQESQLESLVLNSCEIYFQAISDISSIPPLPKLTSIVIDQTMSITDSFILNLINRKTTPLLENLDLSTCKAVTDHSLCQLPGNLNSLKKLNLSGTFVSDQLLFELSTHQFGLEELILGTSQIPFASNHDTLTDQGVLSLAKNCHSLKIIQLHGCSNLTDSSLFMLFIQNPHLENVDLGKTRISNQLFNRLIYSDQHWLHLHSLNVMGCQNLTWTMDRGNKQTILGPMEKFIQKCVPALKYLDCSEVPNLNSRYVFGFRNNSKVSFSNVYFPVDILHVQQQKNLYQSCRLGDQDLKRWKRHMSFLVSENEIQYNNVLYEP